MRGTARLNSSRSTLIRSRLSRHVPRSRRLAYDGWRLRVCGRPASLWRRVMGGPSQSTRRGAFPGQFSDRHNPVPGLLAPSVAFCHVASVMPESAGACIVIAVVGILLRGMAFEWDSVKNQANIKKHGVSFEAAKRIFEDTVVTRPDTRRDYRETRYISIGKVANAFLVVVHTYRGGNIRLISARSASRKERETYRERI